jgi:hypothetical protein
VAEESVKLDEAIEVVDAHAREMLDRDDAAIELIAVGAKDGTPLNRAESFCVTAFVKEKLTATKLKERHVAKFAHTFAAVTRQGAPAAADIDVVECGSAFVPQIGLSVPTPQRGRYGGPSPICDSQKWFRALRCGIGITNPTGEYPERLSVGTAGFYLVDGEGRQYVVSNNHVIGRSNAASPGEIVVQPGTLDLTTRELRAIATQAALAKTLGIAELSALVRLEFRDPRNIPINHVDGALARLRDSESSGRSYADLDRLTYSGGIAGVGIPFGSGGGGGSIRVHKVGRTTGFTEGEITHINGTATIPYPGGHAYFARQIVIQATADNVGSFSRPGDSGSGILDDRNQLVGLLFAGSDDQTLANPIPLVLEALRSASGIPDLSVVTT